LLCNQCGKCIEACELQAVVLTDKGIKINREKCTGCGKCVEVCGPEALKIYGKEMSVEEVYSEIKRDELYYRNSGGGVTASGGEPLSQSGFLAALFKRCQDSGIHTCIETCGYAEPSVWEKVLPCTNLVLYDLKLMDSSEHRRMTGKSNEKVLRNLKLVAEARVPLIVRIPLIPDINDSKENLTAIALYIGDIKGIKKVNLLQYHRFGESKYAMLDRPYKLTGLTIPDDEWIEQAKKTFESFKLDCEIVK
jgi:pyruvate formate lyase activating enzyme